MKNFEGTKDQKVFTIFAVNKCDLAEKTISKEELLDLQDSVEGSKMIEVSAIKGIKIDEMFDSAVNTCYNNWKTHMTEMSKDPARAASFKIECNSYKILPKR